MVFRLLRVPAGESKEKMKIKEIPGGLSRKRPVRTVLMGICYSVGKVTRQEKSSLT